MGSTQFSQVDAQSKEETIGLFVRHVSSGKAGFFKSAGIDFVPGRRDGAFLYDLTGVKRVIDCLATLTL